MHIEKPEGDWTVMKKIIKKNFKKLSDESIESINGNWDALSSKLQSSYGYAKDRAEKEILNLRAYIHEATAPEKDTESVKTDDETML